MEGLLRGGIKGKNSRTTKKTKHTALFMNEVVRLLSEDLKGKATNHTSCEARTSATARKPLRYKEFLKRPSKKMVGGLKARYTGE